MTSLEVSLGSSSQMFLKFSKFHKKRLMLESPFGVFRSVILLKREFFL